MRANEHEYFLKRFLKNYSYADGCAELPQLDYDYLASKISSIKARITLLEEEGICKNIKSEIERTGGDFEKISKQLISKIPYIIFSEYFLEINGVHFYRSKFFYRFLLFLEEREKFYKIEKILNEILIHEEDIDKYGEEIIGRMKDFFGKNISKSKKARELINTNKRFLFLNDEKLNGLSKSILEKDNALSDYHSRADWPITGGLLLGGLGKRFLRHISKNLKTENHLKSFLDYIKILKKETLDIEPDIIERICINLDENETTSVGELRENAELISDDFLGDPRFNPSKWHSIPKAKDIMIKWKTEKSIKNFFSLLDHISKTDANVKRMWPYRKKFIETYLKAGYIDGAWFVLGKMAYELRDKFLLKNSEKSFGRLMRGATSKQSVLLYKIRNLTLSEWTHNGKVRIWKSGSKKSPNLYEKEYSRADVTLKGEEVAAIPHVPPHENWQKKLASTIYEHTNLDLRREF